VCPNHHCQSFSLLCFTSQCWAVDVTIHNCQLLVLVAWWWMLGLGLQLTCLLPNLHSQSDIILRELTQLKACLEADFFHPSFCLCHKLPLPRLALVLWTLLQTMPGLTLAALVLVSPWRKSRSCHSCGAQFLRKFDLLRKIAIFHKFRPCGAQIFHKSSQILQFARRYLRFPAKVRRFN